MAAINKHSSLLPEYRGIFPVVWTLLEQRVPIGLTIHVMSARLDSGPILVRRTFPGLVHERSVATIYDRLHAEAPGLLVEALELLAGPTRQSKPLIPEKAGSYRGLPAPPDLVRLRERGIRFA